MTEQLAAVLERDGVVRLPSLLADESLTEMQAAFRARLKRMRWSSSDGYERTDLYRHMIEDVLLLAQGFVDVALHPIVQRTLADYIGGGYQLVEAKGWKSLPTTKDFHGWHGDEWYDQHSIREIPREVKLALYVTDVRSGAFSYVVGSHQQQAPHMLKLHETRQITRDRIVEVIGPAGTAFLFDTTGIHRQGAPILHERWAVFYNYHDPAVRLQAEDREEYRYHPLLLNAAFLGGLHDEDRRVLGFGDKRNYVHAFERRSRQEFLEAVSRLGLAVKLRADAVMTRVSTRLARRRAAPTGPATSERADRTV